MFQINSSSKVLQSAIIYEDDSDNSGILSLNFLFAYFPEKTMKVNAILTFKHRFKDRNDYYYAIVYTTGQTYRQTLN